MKKCIIDFRFSFSMIILILTSGCLHLQAQNTYQYLKPNDINIFIKNYTTLDVVYNRLESSDEEYILLAMEIADTFLKLCSDDLTVNEFILFRKVFQKYINYEISKEMKDAFKRMGWGNNGHQKFCIILYGTGGLLSIKENPENKNLKLRILEIINEHDLAVLENHEQE
jgi:hypothetical protein